MAINAGPERNVPQGCSLPTPGGVGAVVGEGEGASEDSQVPTLPDGVGGPQDGQ